MFFAAAQRLALVVPFALLGWDASPARAQEIVKRFARVGVDGARILNLADEKGVAIASPAQGTLVTVHEEIGSGWSSIEIPGGFPVWVYGAYLEETPTGGIYEVTGNAVNLRPMPSNDIQSFPLPQRLNAGTRVQSIEVSDASASSKKTWVRVWSPPGIRAWIASSALVPLAAGEDGAALWDEALKSAARVAVPIVSRATPAKAPGKGEVDPNLRAEFESARELLKNERVKEAPDYPVVRRALEAVLVKSPTGPLAVEARNQLELLAPLEEAAAIEVELARERERRALKAREDQRIVWEKSRAKDPLGEAFLSRGVLTREQGIDGKARYWLSFGGKRVAEVQCSSGRYALDLFAGYEVGVQGIESAGSEPSEGRMKIELTKLEVIGRR